jgi:hypothetical protein
MSNASSIPTLYRTPDLGRHGKHNASNPAAQTWPGSRLAIVKGKRGRKPVAGGAALQIGGYSRRGGYGLTLIWRKTSLLSRLFFDRAAGTAIGLAPGEDRDRGFIFEFPQEIVGDGLEEFAFDSALAPASSAQSLKNPHRVLR